jgi:hypothetical protein
LASALASALAFAADLVVVAVVALASALAFAADLVVVAVVALALALAFVAALAALAIDGWMASEWKIGPSAAAKMAVCI